MRQRRILAGNPFWPGDEARPGLGTAGRGRDQKALPTESIPDPLEFSPLQAVNEIINARKRITAETAKELAAAFGTSAHLWLNLENAYRLARAAGPDPGVSKRAAQLAASK
jgi:hypothetical protein